MKPKDIRTAADVATWLRHHVEWSDEASRDMALAAVRVLGEDTRDDQIRALRAAIAELLSGMRDPAHRGGMGATLPLDYEMPPSTNKRVRRLLEAALAATDPKDQMGGET